AVVAVARVGVERDVAQEAEVWYFFFDGVDRAADQVLGIESFVVVLVAQLRIGVGKQRDAGDRKLACTHRLAHCLIDRQSLDLGHGIDWYLHIASVDNEQRPDQVVGGEYVLAHYVSRPFAAAVAAWTAGEVEAGGRLGG